LNLEVGVGGICCANAPTVAARQITRAATARYGVFK
jgi:hypothetical protein